MGAACRPGRQPRRRYWELVRQCRLVDASEHGKKAFFLYAHRDNWCGADSVEVEKAARAFVTHYSTAGMMLRALCRRVHFVQYAVVPGEEVVTE